MMIRSFFAPVALGLVLSVMLAACSMSPSSPRLANPDPNANPPSTSRGSALPSDGVVSVRPGDTIYALARRYGISPRTIIETNRLAPPYLLHVGDRLMLPVPRVHVVKAGDTVSEIARDRRISMEQLVALNGLRPPYAIRVGQRLNLPAVSDGSNGTVVASREPQNAPIVTEPVPAPRDPTQPWSSNGTLNFPVSGSPPDPVAGGEPPLPTVRPSGSTSSNQVTFVQAPTPPPPPVSTPAETAARTAILTPAPRSARRFQWPVKGRVIAAFGPREGGLHNDGINIAANKGEQIRAAENGVVVYAGNELRGFGNLLLIKHADGWTTAYAHADALLVRRGDRVARGQPIATVGETGNVDRPQLHFEIRKGQRAVDPRDELAESQASLPATWIPRTRLAG
ncbi:Membrane protein [alpha proteobacterium BAL199]|jgi:murein DD-endopeptidase MepM/ murein hydrolase activator NlpD|nr:Membrane protein [alpha proteobacterium BAL199]